MIFLDLCHPTSHSVDCISIGIICKVAHALLQHATKFWCLAFALTLVMQQTLAFMHVTALYTDIRLSAINLPASFL